MENKSALPSFTEADIKRVLGSPEGQALLKLLNNNHNKNVTSATIALTERVASVAKETLVKTMVSSKSSLQLTA